jgi:hypothetical protein
LDIGRNIRADETAGFGFHGSMTFAKIAGFAR